MDVSIEITTALLAEMAGWEAMKQARGMIAAERVLDSAYEPPILKGTVQVGTTTLKSGLALRSRVDVDNLCPCRDSRQRGIICAHSVAVGLHFLQQQQPVPVGGKPVPGVSGAAAVARAKPAVPAGPDREARTLRRAGPGAEGEPLELQIILPPNLADSPRGKVTVYLEGKWRRGRMPANALPLDESFALSQQDDAVLAQLEEIAGGDTPAMVQLTASQLSRLLSSLAGHPRVWLGRDKQVTVRSEPVTLELSASLESNGDVVVTLHRAPAGKLISAEPAWLLAGTQMQPLAAVPGLDGLLRGPLRIPRSHVPFFLSQTWPTLVASSKVDADFTAADFVFEPAQPRFKLHLQGGLAMLDAKLECLYGNQSAASLPPDLHWLPDPADPLRYRTRNPQAEQEAVGRLTRHGFVGPDTKGLLHLRGQDLVLNFFAREYPRLEKEWEVTLEERLERSTRENIERVEPEFRVTPSGQNWFHFEVSYATCSGQRFDPAEIQRLLRSGHGHSRLKNGKFVVLDTGAVEELQEVLVDANPEQQAGAYRMSNAQAGFLEATLQRQPAWRVEAPAGWSQRAAIQRGEVQPPAAQLGALESVLRPYQKQGVAWIRFLRANGFGGVLADEMGLGKTVQMLAHLATTRRESPSRTLKPSLVVCPSSLVFNWAAEAQKFTPNLRVLPLQGADRKSQFPRIPESDLVITSYALLRRDYDAYRAIDFDTVVLDEAQHIKNRETQNAQAVKAIRCAHRLVLTGTPIENSVLDLWSIFDFLMPGYLGQAKDFRERYETPIVRERNVAAQDRLARRVRPFILRRLKREVAADLPRKIEQVSFCELTEEQRALYEQILEAGRREVLNLSGDGKQAQSRMAVLTALLRLRQVCCDPRLLKLEAAAPGDSPAPGPGASVPSGKVEMFGELLEEVLDGNHRVLVFSQFTSMLQLLKERLERESIEYCYLDGSTPDRRAVVERFQRDGRVPVFLISLKAGGVGLNLTGADTVIHFDPWWNPAVEAQATDRAHRIGQRNVVTSYKLITRGTVEEKILELQNRKKALFDGMLGGEEQLTGSLSWQEMQELLSG